MIDHSLEVVESLDIILITGDFLGHGLSTWLEVNEHYDLLKQTLKKAVWYV